MRKMYSFFAAVVMAATVNAQVFNATFDDVEGTGGNDDKWGGQISSTGLSSYSTGGTWVLSNAYEGDGCIKLGASSKLGSITTPEIALTGKGTLTFRAGAWDGKNENTTLNISATGGKVSLSSVALTKGEFNEFTVDITEAKGTLKITFTGEKAANSRFFIDDIKVIDATMAVVDTNARKATLVKNTSVSDRLIFAAKGNVKIYTTSGQIVKSAQVEENTALDLSSLPKGLYIVSGDVNGEAVSQKIIKK